MSTPVTPRAGSLELPAPVGVIGNLTLIVGLLVAVLAFLPQHAVDRWMTAGSAAVLILLGSWMRRRRETPAPLDAPACVRCDTQSPV